MIISAKIKMTITTIMGGEGRGREWKELRRVELRDGILNVWTFKGELKDTGEQDR